MQANRVLPLVEAIDACITILCREHLWETAELLRMARLDLVVRANGISEAELELFSSILAPPEEPTCDIAARGGSSTSEC